MPEKYRERARDAERQSQGARNEDERDAFLEIARLWESLADLAVGETPAKGNRAAD